jgi:citrate lyase synthetase
VFHLTSTEYGQTFYAETFQTLDDACDFLNLLEAEQDRAYSFSRELSIAELKGQIQDFLLESED